MMLLHFKSISSRLIFYVTLSVLAMFTMVVGVLIFVQYLLAMGLFMVTTSWHVDSKASMVEKRLGEVQTTILSHDVRVMNNIMDQQRLAFVFQDILYNDNIYACGIALKPEMAGGHRYLLYACRDGAGGVKVTLRPEDYAYEERDYFKEAERQMAPYWSDPYVDDTLRIATFSHPLLDREGDFVGVLCADVLLDSIANYVVTAPGTSNSTIVARTINTFCGGATSFMLSKNGYFIIPPDTTVSFLDTYETYAMRHHCPEFRRIGEIMVTRSGKRVGIFDDFKMEGHNYKTAYSYINKVGWTVVTLYPTEFINGFITCFGFVIFFVLLLGVLLLVLIIYMIVRRSTRPLQKLVAASKEMSQGNFDIKLPVTHHRDEVQTLRDSFEEMRLSLKDYVLQLKLTTANNERMEQELNIANHIQMSMLPSSFPKPPEVEEVSVFSYLKSAREVGGDLYDFFIRGGHLHFIIADVSGKGMPAAMIMAVTTSMFRALQRRDIVPERTVNALNNMLLERNSADMFVTLVVGDLNLATGELALCNAGHNLPLLIKKDEVRRLKLQTNIPIGVFQNYHYKADHLKLDCGERVLFYTDGVTEAVNASDNLFGEERLMAATRKYGAKDVEAFVGSMVNDINAFTGETMQSDDITMMMMEYHGSHNVITREMSFANDMGEVTRATAMIDEVCATLAVPDVVSSSLQLALEEAMVNVISYAYLNGRANIDNHFKITSDGKSISFLLSDSGMPFDPTQAETPDTSLGIEARGVGGLGILLVRKIMDVVSYQRKNNRNILIMKKNL